MCGCFGLVDSFLYLFLSKGDSGHVNTSTAKCRFCEVCPYVSGRLKYNSFQHPLKLVAITSLSWSLK